MEYYDSALKKGKAFYKKKTSSKEVPYLPVLDEILPAGKSDMGSDIGLKNIPAELIVGTKTRGRTNTFAGNFMPLAEGTTEFASKWESLAQAHVEEGIRDPIIVWEYMNRFYVQEGNKRASVLKYFESPQILANVKRILPARTEDEDVLRYYELLEFSKYSKVNVIEFSKIESYKEFLKYLGKEPKTYWSDEDSKKLNSTYYYFKKAYLSKKGDQLKSTVSDALLSYIRVFGYDDISKQSITQISDNLNKLWKDIVLLDEDEQIEVKLDPSQKNNGPKLLSNLFYTKKNVAFIYRDDIKKSGWRKNHEAGRKFIEESLGKKISTKAYICKEKSVEETIVSAIDEGANIIFATGSTMWSDCLKLAVEYPNVRFFNCALNKPSKVVSSYYPRMYEAKFISGAIAGTLTRTNKIGYICKYPIYGMITEINAFARGVNLVNPRAKVYVEWSSVDGIDASETKCLDEGCDLISYRDSGRQDEEEKRMVGLTFFDSGKKNLVAMPLFNWGAYYEKIIQSIIDGSLENDESKTRKSFNYYWGISSGVIDLMYAEKLPLGVRYLGEVLFKAIQQGICNPFYNPNPDPNGTFQWNTSGMKYSAEEIIQMDHFENNIIGTIPKINEVNDDTAKEVIKNVGIKSAKEEV